MPEGDAVWRTARRLDAALREGLVTDFDLRWPGVATQDFRGRRTVAVLARGKHILHRFDHGWTLHTHLRMDGRWLVFAPGGVARRHLAARQLRALVGTRSAVALGYELGMLDVVRTRDEGHLVGHLGPDLLGEDWDAARAAANVAREPGTAIGAALLDQRNLAGIGTIWNAETLFCERVWPWTPVGDLPAARLEGLIRRAHSLLNATLRFDSSVSTGDPRRPTFAYGRAGRPCVSCGGRIEAGRIGAPPQDRVMYHCPRCQAPNRTGAARLE